MQDDGQRVARITLNALVTYTPTSSVSSSTECLMPKSRRIHPGWPVRLLSGIALLLFAGWVLLVGSLHPHEMIVGAVVVLLSTSFCAVVLRSDTLALELRLRDLMQLWHVPGEIAKDAWVITSVLFRDLLFGQRAESLYRVAGFKASRRNPVLVARAALAIAYTTLSPNTIVLGIDPAQGHMLFHQLRRDDLPASTRALGAGK